MSLFKGAGVALVTPFTEDKTIDYESLERLLEFQLANHTDAIIVGGTTGEPATMKEEERLSLISFVVEKVNRKVPVIAGTGANCTENVVDFSKNVEALGVDGLLVVTPYYNKCTQRGLYEHYKMVAEAVKLPIIMYNVPSRTGLNIMPETAVTLARDCENIVAIKEASGDFSQIADLAEMGQGILDIYSGNDDQILPVLSLGGIGVISVLSNVAPQETHDMVISYLEGDLKKATGLQLKYLKLVRELFAEVNPIPAKWAAHLMGYGAGCLRLPLTELEAEHKKSLEAELKNLSII